MYVAGPICVLERITGAAPVPEVWKTPILLLYDTRILLFFSVSFIYIIAKISQKIKFLLWREAQESNLDE